MRVRWAAWMAGQASRRVELGCVECPQVLAPAVARVSLYIIGRRACGRRLSSDGAAQACATGACKKHSKGHRMQGELTLVDTGRWAYATRMPRYGVGPFILQDRNVISRLSCSTNCVTN